jgi:integrase
MVSPRIYGPYPARSGFRLVVLEGKARKSIVVSSVAEAEKLRGELQLELGRHRDRSVGEALLEYGDYLQRCRGASTAQAIARAIGRFLGEDTALGALTPQSAARLYEAETRRIIERTGQPAAAASHRTVLGQCKRFYAWAIERGYVADSPFAAVKPVGRPRTGKAQLRIAEARRFVALTVAKAEGGDRGAIAALTALLLGMRAGEVLQRVVRDLDDQGRVLWITRGKTDNARRRLTVPEVLRPLLGGLAQGKPPEALLFGAGPSGAGKPLSDAWLWGQVQRLCDEAKVPRVSTHSLRGLHSTLALEAGATASAVAAALGHGSFQITAKHYAAPGTIERLRSQTVEQALATADPAAATLASLDPAALCQAVQRLPPALRAALLRALTESP